MCVDNPGRDIHTGTERRIRLVYLSVNLYGAVCVVHHLVDRYKTGGKGGVGDAVHSEGKATAWMKLLKIFLIGGELCLLYTSDAADE